MYQYNSYYIVILLYIARATIKALTFTCHLDQLQNKTAKGMEGKATTPVAE